MPRTLLLSLLFFTPLLQAADNMVTVPAGPFMMGCSPKDVYCNKDEGPMGGTQVKVPAFRIDIHEVSVTEYRKCMAAGKCSRPKDHERNAFCNLNAPDRDNHPINCVDWQQAADYCAWKGKRLPREAEWEKAARAGTTTRFPWGGNTLCNTAILDDLRTKGADGERDGCGKNSTWPVGSRPANPLGLYDMHGNVAEWTSTSYAADAITKYYARGKLNGPKSSPRKVVRGGAWNEYNIALRSSHRLAKPPRSDKAEYVSIGFRCAADEGKGSK